VFSFNRMQIATRLALLVGISTLALLMVAAMSYFSISQVSGGPLHQELELYSDLAADVSPSPLCLERVRLTVRGMMINGRAQLPEAIDRYNHDKQQYEAAVANWSRRLPEGNIRELLLVTADEANRKYMETVENRVIPALKKGDRKTASDAEAKLLAFSDRNMAAREEAIRLVQARQAQVAGRTATVIRSATLTLAGLALMFALLLSAIGLVTVKSVATPSRRALGFARALSDGNLTQEQIEISGADELAQLGTALNTLQQGLRSVMQSLAGSARDFAFSSEELTSTSERISANTEQTSAQVNVVSEATRQVTHNLQSVSVGAEQMTTTIQSIACNAHEAATIATKAVETAQAATSAIGKLGESSGQIGDVIKVITSIAQQTKLLALNATIEAARAGDAGKGFAVVASEVKELARQTAKATEDISHKIATIQTDTNRAVEAIATISGIINQVDEISGTIATAVEEQSATTNEMTRNLADAAKASTDITQTIVGVADSAQAASASAGDSQKAAGHLAELALQLRQEVEQFKISTQPGAEPPPAKAADLNARAAHLTASAASAP